MSPIFITVYVGQCEHTITLLLCILFHFPLFQQIVSYEGKARAALKEAMIQYQAKSGRFDETNPWKQDGFNSTYCCTEFNICDGEKSGFTRMSSCLATWTMVLVWTLRWMTCALWYVYLCQRVTKKFPSTCPSGRVTPNLTCPDEN